MPQVQDHAVFLLGTFKRAQKIPFPRLNEHLKRMSSRLNLFYPRDVYSHVLNFLDFYMEIQKGWRYDTINAEGHVCLGIYYHPDRDMALMVEYSDRGWIDWAWVTYPAEEVGQG